MVQFAQGAMIVVGVDADPSGKAAFQQGERSAPRRLVNTRDPFDSRAKP